MFKNVEIRKDFNIKISTNFKKLNIQILKISTEI